jgi:hypothetical protein
MLMPFPRSLSGLRFAVLGSCLPGPSFWLFDGMSLRTGCNSCLPVASGQEEQPCLRNWFCRSGSEGTRCLSRKGAAVSRVCEYHVFAQVSGLPGNCCYGRCFFSTCCEIHLSARSRKSVGRSPTCLSDGLRHHDLIQETCCRESWWSTWWESAWPHGVVGSVYGSEFVHEILLDFHGHVTESCFPKERVTPRAADS